MADRDGERVGRVRGRGLRVEREDRAHHPLHLPLVSAAVAADRLLHLRGSVLGALEAGRRGRDERGAARLPDGERDAGVGTDEGLLERDGVGRMLPYELGDPVEDRPEARFWALPWACAPAPGVHRLEAPAAFVDDPVPARSRPWVDAEDFHVQRVRSLADGGASPAPHVLVR